MTGRSDPARLATIMRRARLALRLALATAGTLPFALMLFAMARAASTGGDAAPIGFFPPWVAASLTIAMLPAAMIVGDRLIAAGRLRGIESFLWRQATERLVFLVSARLSRFGRLHCWTASGPGVIGVEPGRILLCDASTGFRVAALSGRALWAVERAPGARLLALSYRSPLLGSYATTLVPFASVTAASGWCEALGRVQAGEPPYEGYWHADTARHPATAAAGPSGDAPDQVASRRGDGIAARIAGPWEMPARKGD